MMKKGFSIVEIMLAVSVFALILTAFVGALIYARLSTVFAGDRAQATLLIEEAEEAIRSIHDEKWNEITPIPMQTGIELTSNTWTLKGASTSDTIGQYTRVINLAAVCRDVNTDITACPGFYTDPHTLKATITVSWTTGTVNREIESVSYSTNWNSINWIQTDWAGGSGQTIWSNASKYDTDDGNIATRTAGILTLLSGDTQDDGFDFSTNANVVWPFSSPSNYTYDSEKVVVITDLAQLKLLPGSTTSATTLNSTFDSNANNWTFSTWDAGNQEVTPTGTWRSSGGNPTGYIDIDIPSNAQNDELGGFWEQSISIAEASSTVTCSFDWSIVQWVADDGVDDYQLYVFLDSFTGEPTIGQQIWASGTQSEATGWSGVQDIDCSSSATAEGTYYYKLAVWLDTQQGKATGPITSGYDNAKVHWEKIQDGAYPSDSPTIYPTTSYSNAGIQSWNSFTEVAIKNGGEIYYQLSDDNGATWKYWNGSSWVATATTTSANIASVVHTNIGSFSATNKQITPRAILEGDGTQLVQLDSVEITFSAEGSVWSFATWDVDGGEVTPTGSQQTSSGNPGNYVDITVPDSGNDEVGGYWEQPFTTYRNSPTPVTIDFDYKVVDYNDTPNVSDIRIFVDTASGEPVTQVGSSVSVTAEGGWTSAVQINATSAVPTAGVYYLKVAFWVETPAGGGGNATGPFTIGYDNVNIDLGNGEYKTSGNLTASAFNMADVSPAQLIEWDEIIPTCSPVCSLQFQLRTAPDSGGSPGIWTSWYGATGASTYFTNATGTLVSIDLNGNQWSQYRVELAGDGDDSPVLQEVRVNYR